MDERRKPLVALRRKQMSAKPLGADKLQFLAAPMCVIRIEEGKPCMIGAMFLPCFFSPRGCSRRHFRAQIASKTAESAGLRRNVSG